MLPPVVTGAVVMLIGFNLAGVATDVYLPTDPWIGMLTMLVVILMAVGLKGFLGRIAIFLGLIFGFVVSWLADLVFGPITSPTPSSGGEAIPTTGSTGPASRPPTGSASPGTPPTGWSATRRSPATWTRSAGTCRPSRSRSRCWRCPR